MEVIHTTLEEILDKEGIVTYVINGRSMEPMLLPAKDFVTIKKQSSGFAENDVVLYKNNGKLILHRIVSVCSDNTYQIMGDNCAMVESGIHGSDIIGRLVAFTHDGKQYTIDDIDYKNYVEELRKHERKRKRRKRVRDVIVENLQFMPETFVNAVKLFLDEHLKYKIEF